MIGGHGADTFTGNSYSDGFSAARATTPRTARAGDEVVGGPGNDGLDGGDAGVLGGGAARTRSTAGGVDRFWGDSIGACIPGAATPARTRSRRDGAQETINCGSGADSAVIDNGDFYTNHAAPERPCESVDGAGPGGGGPGGGRAARASS